MALEPAAHHRPFREWRCKGVHPDFPGQRCGKVLMLDYDMPDGEFTLPACPRCRTINTYEKRTLGGTLCAPTIAPA